MNFKTRTIWISSEVKSKPVVEYIEAQRHVYNLVYDVVDSVLYAALWLGIYIFQVEVCVDLSVMCIVCPSSNKPYCAHRCVIYAASHSFRVICDYIFHRKMITSYKKTILLNCKYEALGTLSE